MSSEYIVSLDTGTTKVSMLVGELDEKGTVRVIGAGTGPLSGIKKGVVVDMDQAVASILRVKREAEKMAGVEVTGVCAGLCSPHVKSFNSRGAVVLSGEGREVTAEDVERVGEAAKKVSLPAELEILYAVPQDYTVDGRRGIRDPIGMTACRLEADVHIVTGVTGNIENFQKVLERGGLEIVNIVFEPLATHLAVLDGEESEAGCLVVDIGGSVTSWTLVHGACVRSSGALPVGGQNITSDLSYGLRIPIPVAERLKIEHGVALASLADAEEEVRVPPVGDGVGQSIRTQIIGAIIEPRCEEIFSMIKDAVARNPYYGMLGAGVVLTGGGSLIRGAASVAEQVFDHHVRRAVPFGMTGLAEVVSGAQWSAAVGLLRFEGMEIRAVRVPSGLRDRFVWILDGLKRIAGLY